MHPFAFRTHTHGLGRVVSGYVKHARDSEWTLIGKMDPRLPQMFYPTQTPNLVLKRGDLLAARCTFENDRDRVTSMGATDADEMCNFYVMFYVDGEDFEAKHRNCWAVDDDVALPGDASTFADQTYIEGPLL